MKNKDVRFVIRFDEGYYTQSSDGYISSYSGKSARHAVSYRTYNEAERALMSMQYGGTASIEKIYVSQYDGY